MNWECRVRQKNYKQATNTVNIKKLLKDINILKPYIYIFTAQQFFVIKIINKKTLFKKKKAPFFPTD